MTGFLVGVALAGGFAVLFMVGICKLITARPPEEVYEDAYRNMDALRCPLCQRVKVRGTEHGRGYCVTTPVPPPPPPIVAEVTR